MHLLLAQKGSLNESEEAIDLGQSPADVIFLSAADTELSSLADAARKIGENAPSLRLANLMQLSHPMSIDVYAENTISSSSLVIVRVLGGESYWSYGLEKLYETVRANNVALVVLPGDDKPDPDLQRFCTTDGSFAERIWSYLIEGGPQNMESLLQASSHFLGKGEEPPQSVPLLKAGVWHPHHGVCDLASLQGEWLKDAPVAVISFYRALVQSGGLEPVTALVDALSRRGFNVLPMFVSSLKDPVSVEILRSVFAEAKPDIVLNATGFAVSSPTGGASSTVLDEDGAMVIQIVLAGGSQESWEAITSRIVSSRSGDECGAAGSGWTGVFAGHCVQECRAF